ncbi:MAG: TonB-dependent receptor, partial [Bacteroidaceae bacterium]|nr:TonB-dependent receptor [Bacteroidaceae bacterium]
SQFIGEQYLTNYGVKEMTCWSDWAMDDAHKTTETLMLKKHFTTNIDLSYQFSIPQWSLKSARVGVTLYNVFSAKFDNNGWAAPQFRQDSNGNVYAVNTWGLRDSEAVGFAPSAPFNFMAHFDINF